MNFPSLVYRCPGPHFAHAGQTYEYIGVMDEAELAGRLEAGWSLSLVDAVDRANGVEAEPDDNSPVTREELELKATELGIKFDGRTSDAGLLKKIDAALVGGE